MTKQIGGRRTRKANMWAKAAGEYYRSHKNDPNIKEFSDVLKSPDFKKYYLSKYGKGNKKGSQTKFTRRQKKSFKYQKREPEEEIQEDEKEESEDKEDDKNYEWVKVPKKSKGKKNSKKSQPKEEDNEWKWGGKKGGNGVENGVENGTPATGNTVQDTGVLPTQEQGQGQ
jgi:hypothetical protein